MSERGCDAIGDSASFGAIATNPIIYRMVNNPSVRNGSLSPADGSFPIAMACGMRAIRSHQEPQSA